MPTKSSRRSTGVPKLNTAVYVVFIPILSPYSLPSSSFGRRPLRLAKIQSHITFSPNPFQISTAFLTLVKRACSFGVCPTNVGQCNHSASSSCFRPGWVKQNVQPDGTAEQTYDVRFSIPVADERNHAECFMNPIAAQGALGPPSMLRMNNLAETSFAYHVPALQFEGPSIPL